MLEQLKKVDLDGIPLDVAMSLVVFAKALRAEYEARNISAPEWLDDRLRELNREITTRSRDALEMRLREIEAQEQSLLSASEKRERLAQEKERLQKQLTGA